MGELESNRVRVLRHEQSEQVRNFFIGVAITSLFYISSQMEALPDSEQNVSKGVVAATAIFSVYSLAKAAIAHRDITKENAEQPPLV